MSAPPPLKKHNNRKHFLSSHFTDDEKSSKRIVHTIPNPSGKFRTPLWCTINECVHRTRQRRMRWFTTHVWSYLSALIIAIMLSETRSKVRVVIRSYRSWCSRPTLRCLYVPCACACVCVCVYTVSNVDSRYFSFSRECSRIHYLWTLRVLVDTKMVPSALEHTISS